MHDCGPMGNDCHLDSGAMAEGPLTTATPKVRADALGLSVRAPMFRIRWV